MVKPIGSLSLEEHLHQTTHTHQSVGDTATTVDTELDEESLPLPNQEQRVAVVNTDLIHKKNKEEQHDNLEECSLASHDVTASVASETSFTSQGSRKRTTRRKKQPSANNSKTLLCAPGHGLKKKASSGRQSNNLMMAPSSPVRKPKPKKDFIRRTKSLQHEDKPNNDTSPLHNSFSFRPAEGGVDLMDPIGESELDDLQMSSVKEHQRAKTTSNKKFHRTTSRDTTSKPQEQAAKMASLLRFGQEQNSNNATTNESSSSLLDSTTFARNVEYLQHQVMPEEIKETTFAKNVDYLQDQAQAVTQTVMDSTFMNNMDYLFFAAKS